MSDTLDSFERGSLATTPERRIWETPVLKILSLRDAAKNYLSGTQKMISSPPSPPPAVVRVKSEISTDRASQRLV
ncbi:hypothetical protein [Bradyrhizobium prioriisuperbiae]|uniref:hypothetical protein n=1 Tax=Bradyrhizobium prioriisuperbiae TaxID=2854389 RepID=UPI0028E905C8|nr:hypothetical protein [Bradyrhizobium prioritasuperba]